MKIKEICAGDRHSLVLLANGDLYAFGNNDLGQCTEFESVCKIPKKIDTDYKVIRIFSGANHNILLNEIGEVYGWGDLSYEKFGLHLNKDVQHTPKLMNFLKGSFIEIITAFEHHTIIVTGKKSNSLF